MLKTCSFLVHLSSFELMEYIENLSMLFDGEKRASSRKNLKFSYNFYYENDEFVTLLFVESSCLDERVRYLKTSVKRNGVKRTSSLSKILPKRPDLHLFTNIRYDDNRCHFSSQHKFPFPIIKISNLN